MKNKLLKFGRWAEKNWIQIVVIVGLFLMLELALVFFSWLAGYWCNALFGTHFELSSCWAGIGAIGTALGVVVGLGKAAWTKYSTNTAHTENGLIKSVTDKIGGIGK
nr:MAG TPA: hypothetical protein [Caudoviricetes sp.]